MNIVTCICVDQNKEDESIYPQVLKRSASQRRLIYWKCVSVFFATSFRCNPQAKHILYTNDQLPVRYKHHDLKKFLTELGVNIRYLPFDTFKPPKEHSKKFRNAFYKLDVIRALGRDEKEFSILIDSDCVWVKNNAYFLKNIKPGKLLVYDCYRRTNPYEPRSGLSQVDLGKAFKQIDPTYSIEAPVHYGGELIGGTGHMLQFVSEQMLDFFQKIITQFEQNPLILPNNNSILDYDEYVTSYVLNKMQGQLQEAGGFIKRIQTSLENNEALPEDLHLTVWHLFAEKKMGFAFLFKQVINKSSPFWTVPIDRFNTYIGKYMGVPSRNSMLEIFLLKAYKGWSSFMYLIGKKLKLTG